MKKIFLCLAALPLFMAHTAMAQTPAPTAPMCAELKSCADKAMPNVDDGSSPPDKISDAIAPLCRDEMKSCGKELTAATNTQAKQTSVELGVDTKMYMDEERTQKELQKRIKASILDMEVWQYRATKGVNSGQ